MEIDAAAERVHTLSTKVQLWLEKHSRLLAELKVRLRLASISCDARLAEGLVVAAQCQGVFEAPMDKLWMSMY